MRVSTRTVAPSIGANGDAKDRVVKRGTERQAIVRHILDWRREHCPDQGVDALVTRPLEFMGMAISVARRAGRVDVAVAAEFVRELMSFRTDNKDVLAIVDQVCREAMCARKRGELNTKNGGAKPDEATDRGSTAGRPPAPGTPGRAGGVVQGSIGRGKARLAKAPASRPRKTKGAQRS